MLLSPILWKATTWPSRPVPCHGACICFFCFGLFVRVFVAFLRYCVWLARRGTFFKDGSAPITDGAFVAVSHSDGDGNTALVRLRGSINFATVLFNVRAHNRYQTSCSFLSINFQLVETGEVPPS